MTFSKSLLHCSLCLVVAAAMLIGLSTTSNANDSRDILKAAELNQGLCLVIDDEDGQLIAALARDSRLYVQGCVNNKGSVAASRSVLVEAGVAHRASVVMREDDHLPYGDNLINLVVVPNWRAAKIDLEEVLRVLTAGGTAVCYG